jgi:hypothetical protein
MDDDYNIAFDILTEAVQKMGAQGITSNNAALSAPRFVTL